MEDSAECELLKTRLRNRRKREFESRSGMNIVSTLAAEGRLAVDALIAWRECIVCERSMEMGRKEVGDC